MELGVRVRREITPASLLIPGRRPVRDQTATGNMGCSALVPSKGPASQAGGKVTQQLSRCFPAGGVGWEIGSSKLPVTTLEWFLLSESHMAAAGRRRGGTSPAPLHHPALTCAVDRWTTLHPTRPRIAET